MRKLLLLAFIGLFVLNTTAQDKKDVVTKFIVLLDNKNVESDSIFISLAAFKKVIHPLKLTNNFTTWLQPDCVYTIVIEHPRYQKQVFDLDTHNSKDTINLRIYLTKGFECYNGYIRSKRESL